MKDYISYVPINNTTLNFNAKGIKNLLVQYFTRAMIRTLNYACYDVLAIENEEKTTTNCYAVLKYCGESNDGVVFGDMAHLFSRGDFKINGDMKIFNVPLIYYPLIKHDEEHREDREKFIIGDLKNGCAYLYNSKMKLGINISSNFAKNQTLFTIEHKCDFVPLDKNKFICICDAEH